MSLAPTHEEIGRAFRAGEPDTLAYSVDMTQVVYHHTANSDGNMYPSARRKMHRHRPGDCLAACSSRVLTNWPDEPGQDPANFRRDQLCRRCFPEVNRSSDSWLASHPTTP